MSGDALIIFTKNAEEGKVKTRLAATIGNAAALDVFRRLQEITMSATVHIAVDKFVFYSDVIETSDVWDNQYFHKAVQLGGELGERMTNALASVFRKGYKKVVIIGTDCPELQTEIIDEAFLALDSCDVVVGPAEDGGYYLIGMKQLCHELFIGVSWSTSTVLSETLEKMESNKLHYRLLKVLRDIDEEKDLHVLNIRMQ